MTCYKWLLLAIILIILVDIILVVSLVWIVVDIVIHLNLRSHFVLSGNPFNPTKGELRGRSGIIELAFARVPQSLMASVSIFVNKYIWVIDGSIHFLVFAMFLALFLTYWSRVIDTMKNMFIKFLAAFIRLSTHGLR